LAALAALGLITVIAALGGCSPSAASATDAGPDGASDYNLTEAMLICGATLSELNANLAGCVCSTVATTLPCASTEQACAENTFWYSFRPSSITTTCVYAADGSFLSSTLCSDAHGCRTVGPKIDPPASCPAAKAVCH
jgi:hypothetical protein